MFRAIGRGRFENPKECWAAMGIVYKFFFATSLLLSLLAILTYRIPGFFMN